MKTGQRDFQALALSFYEAANQVLRADATAMLEHWSERDDVSYCDPNGQVLATSSLTQQSATRQCLSNSRSSHYAGK